MPSYTFKKQVERVITTMALHNYIRRHSQNYNHFDETMDEPSHSNSEHISKIASPKESYDTTDNIAQNMTILGDAIAQV